MTMTRRQLKAMGLPQETIEQLIALHMETVDSLRQERDAWQEAAGERDTLRDERDRLLEQVTNLEAAAEQRDAVQQAFDTYRAEVERRERTQLTEQTLRDALLARGANALAVPLLLKAVPPEAAQVEDGRVTNAQELVEDVYRTYGAFFSRPERVGVPVLTPPLSPAPPMTREALQAMEVEEINRNWSSLKDTLLQVQSDPA